MSVWPVGEKLLIVCWLLAEPQFPTRRWKLFISVRILATVAPATFKWFLKCHEESRHNELLSWVLLPLFEIVIKLVYRSVHTHRGCIRVECVCLAGETADGVTLRLAWDGQTVSCHSLSILSPFFFPPPGSCHLTVINSCISPSHFLCLQVFFSWLAWERKRGEGKSAMPKADTAFQVCKCACVAVSQRPASRLNTLCCVTSNIREAAFTLLHSPHEQVQLGSFFNPRHATGDHINPPFKANGGKRKRVKGGSSRETLWER